jgi:hypothetical protein
METKNQTKGRTKGNRLSGECQLGLIAQPIQHTQCSFELLLLLFFLEVTIATIVISGHIPAQDARRGAEPKRLIYVPISERMIWVQILSFPGI